MNTIIPINNILYEWKTTEHCYPAGIAAKNEEWMEECAQHGPIPLNGQAQFAFESDALDLFGENHFSKFFWGFY